VGKARLLRIGLERRRHGMKAVTENALTDRLTSVHTHNHNG
jgi:hypothetical protein